MTHSGVCGGLKETRVLWMGGVDAARASRAVLRAQDPRRAGHRAGRPRPAPLEPGWAGGERRAQGPQGRGAGRAPRGGDPVGGEVAGAGGGARSRTWTTRCARTREALPAHGLVGGGARPNVVVATKLPEAPAAARAPQAGAESPTRGRGGRRRPRVLAAASGARLTRPLAQRLPLSKRILRSRPPGASQASLPHGDRLSQDRTVLMWQPPRGSAATRMSLSAPPWPQDRLPSPFFTHMCPLG